jgi:hypothetical protein
MAYCMLFDPTSTLSQITDFATFAEARFGGNGMFWMPPELVAGTASGTTAGRATWDSDLSDGLDTGDVAFAFEADLATGETSFATDIEGSSAAEGGSQAGAGLSSVLIRVGTQVQSKVSWSALTITFWDADSAGESISIPAGVEIDTTQSSTGVGERLLAVTPESQKWDRVTVSGSLRFEAEAGTCPGWCDLFGQIFINA